MLAPSEHHFALFCRGLTYACLPKASLSVQELEAGIRNEYAKNYLWTGDINESLYEVRLRSASESAGLLIYNSFLGSAQNSSVTVAI